MEALEAASELGAPPSAGVRFNADLSTLPAWLPPFIGAPGLASADWWHYHSAAPQPGAPPPASQGRLLKRAALSLLQVFQLPSASGLWALLLKLRAVSLSAGPITARRDHRHAPELRPRLTGDALRVLYSDRRAVSSNPQN